MEAHHTGDCCTDVPSDVQHPVLSITIEREDEKCRVAQISMSGI